ncbi:flagellar basal-body rod protein FlgC [Desulfovibrio sp. X2]|uniref:flagellar basal body rod protein FlgC n=1 Tax=Desulfovibrio sp. X2 TaxID=941449 RepID=UPI00035875C0|nr:flagellar basal body rod protein FlgC [Desulfovibrio sp. X2]EPR44302.1 flagellar basal-body rod protein FlgC [Desulfovibrio sp. X2]
MDFMTALDVAASGMGAQRSYLNVISMNLANMNTTRTAEGGPYVRKSVSMETTDVYDPFDAHMWDANNRELKGVKIDGIVADKRPFKKVYDPGHPDADKDGFVKYPDINVVEEMANMITAMRSYEANAASVEAAKTMYNKALAIGQG